MVDNSVISLQLKDMAIDSGSVEHKVWVLVGVGLAILIGTAVIFWVIDRRSARRLAEEHRTASEKYK